MGLARIQARLPVWAYRLKFPGVFLSTMPAYVCVAYLLGEVVRCALKM